MAFIPCVKWVQRGLVVGVPEKVTLTREELSEIIASSSSTVNVERSNNDPLTDSEDEEMTSKYDLDNYDNPEDGSSNPLGIGTLAVYSSPDSAPESHSIDNVDENDTDEEDDEIKATDNLVIVGKSSRELTGNDLLEIYVYNHETHDCYVHHDINLPSCPLALELILVKDSGEDTINSFVAVGEMKPFIEIYNLGLMNPMEPFAVLGSWKKVHKKECHASSVLDLSWNKSYSHILASGSEDKSVILWDLETLKCATLFSDYNGIVENLEWNPNEAATLLTCCSDGCLNLLDARDMTTPRGWTIPEEALICHWLEDFKFLVGSSKGKIYQFDMRIDKPLSELDEHYKDITGLTSIPGYPGLIASTAVDGVLKLWDYKSNPKIVHTHYFDTEELHTCSFNPDVGVMGCFGGANEKKDFLKITNISRFTKVIRKWNSQ